MPMKRFEDKFGNKTNRLPIKTLNIGYTSTPCAGTKKRMYGRIIGELTPTIMAMTVVIKSYKEGLI